MNYFGERRISVSLVGIAHQRRPSVQAQVLFLTQMARADEALA
jgi:hypothetical protein